MFGIQRLDIIQMMHLFFGPVLEDPVRIGKTGGMGLGNGPVTGFFNDIQVEMKGVCPAVNVFFFGSGWPSAFDAERIQYGIVLLMIEIGAVLCFLYGSDAFLCPAFSI